MTANFYKIEALTNMHVGSGDANYGVIDNLIQRDAVTDLPTINGSSLKGALREFFEEQWTKKDDKIKTIFGNDDKNAEYRFLSANLLAIPVRSNKKAYFLATAPMIIEQLKNDSENFGGEIDLSVFDNLKPEDKKPIVFTDKTDLLIEDFENFEKKDKTGTTIFEDFKKLIIFSDNDFKKLCADTNLPVIARNKVGDNLWYEQIVPHKSLFTFIVLHPNKHIDEAKQKEKNENFKVFNNLLTNEKSIIHIGANATVGYGFTKIYRID